MLVTMPFLLVIYFSLVWFSSLSIAFAQERIPHVSRRQSSGFNSTNVLDVFQVYQPVLFGSTGCNYEAILVEHTFASSYGQPFVGEESVLLLHSSAAWRIANRAIIPSL